MKCDCPHCHNLATHYDVVHNLICEECMEREIEEESTSPEDYETL